MIYPFLESQEQSHTVTWLCRQREGEEERGEQGRKEGGIKLTLYQAVPSSHYVRMNRTHSLSLVEFKSLKKEP